MAIAAHGRIRDRLGTIVLAASAALTIGAGPAAPEPQEARPGNAWLGIFLGDALDGGVQIVGVLPGGPGERAGLRQGDVVLAIGDRETSDRLVLGDAVDEFRAGDLVPVRILRDGAVREVKVASGASPASATWSVAPTIPGGDVARTPRARYPFLRDAPELGLEIREIPAELRLHFGAPAETGVLVASVEPDSPAARAGVRVGDVVVRAAGRPVARPIDLVLAATGRSQGRAMPLELVRAGKPVGVELTVAPAARDGEAAERDLEILRLREEVEALRRALEEERAKNRQGGS